MIWLIFEKKAITISVIYRPIGFRLKFSNTQMTHWRLIHCVAKYFHHGLVAPLHCLNKASAFMDDISFYWIDACFSRYCSYIFEAILKVYYIVTSERTSHTHGPMSITTFSHNIPFFDYLWCIFWYFIDDSNNLISLIISLIIFARIIDIFCARVIAYWFHRHNFWWPPSRRSTRQILSSSYHNWIRAGRYSSRRYHYADNVRL